MQYKKNHLTTPRYTAHELKETLLWGLKHPAVNGSMNTGAIIWRSPEEARKYRNAICTPDHPYHDMAIYYSSGELGPFIRPHWGGFDGPDCVFVHLPSNITIADVMDLYCTCRTHMLHGPITFLPSKQEVDIK